MIPVKGLIWDPDKERKLLAERGICLHEIKEILESGRHLDVLCHPTRPDQVILPVSYRGKIHAVILKPEPDKVVLKTCYPSRKLGKRFQKP